VRNRISVPLFVIVGLAVSTAAQAYNHDGMVFTCEDAESNDAYILAWHQGDSTGVVIINDLGPIPVSVNYSASVIRFEANYSGMWRKIFEMETGQSGRVRVIRSEEVSDFTHGKIIPLLGRCQNGIWSNVPEEGNPLFK